jgi:hypothetical protein
MAETLEELQSKINLYENDGAAKLYYSLNRKMNEMADIMNKNNLGSMSIDDAKDKTFDRLKVIWQDAASIATAVKTLGDIAGVTGNEKKDTERRPFIETVATKRD